LFRYFPVQLLLSRLPPATIALDFGLSVAWLGVALLLFNSVRCADLAEHREVQHRLASTLVAARVWRAGVRRYNGASS
jgi:hypothetical protein